MSRPSRGTAPAVIGIAVGAIGLAVVACFAIFLPKVHAHPIAGAASESSSTASSPATSSAAIKLPDRLPGGYIASDLPEAFAGSDFDANKTEISALEAKNRAYADGVLSAVLDEPVATRVYAGPSAQSRVSVQAFRATGGAFAPVDLPDPETASTTTQTTVSFVRQDGAACQITAAPAATPPTGPPSTQPSNLSSVTCQEHQGDATVQMTAQGVELADIVKLMGDILDDVAASS